VTNTPTTTPTPTNSPTPTPVPSSTPTATATPTAAPAPAVDLGVGVGRPGGVACLPSVLKSDGAQVAGTGNDIGFDADKFAFGTCTINPAIGTGTVPDKHLNTGATGPGLERIEVTGNLNLIPDGVLYGCTISIGTGVGAGTYALSNTPSAVDTSGAPIAATAGAPGHLIVTTCTGDCDGNGMVTIGEVVKCVNMFLGHPFCDPVNPALGCPVADSNLDGAVSIGEVVQCVNRFLGGCL